MFKSLLLNRNQRRFFKKFSIVITISIIFIIYKNLDVTKESICYKVGIKDTHRFIQKQEQIIKSLSSNLEFLLNNNRDKEFYKPYANVMTDKVNNEIFNKYNWEQTHLVQR